MKKLLLFEKIIFAALLVFSLSVFATKAGLDTAVSVISLGVIGAFFWGERWREYFAEKNFRNFFIFSLVFCLLGAISLFGAVDKFSAFKRLVIISGYYGLLFGILCGLRKQNWHFLINVIVLVIILESIVGAVQYFLHFDILGRPLAAPYRIMGTLSYPNDLGFALGVFLPFLFSLFLAENNSRQKLFFLAGLLFAGFALIFTFTRGAWLGAAVAISMIGILKSRKILLGLVIIIGLALLLPAVRQRIKETSWQMETTRRYFLKHTPELIRRKPFLGWGLDNFKPVFYNYYSELPDSQKGHFHPHNLYLSIAFQTGILGLLSFLLMFYFLLAWLISVFRQGKTPVSLMALGTIGSITDFLIHGLVDEPWRAYQAPYVLFFIIGVVAGQWLGNSQDKTPLTH